MSRVFIDPSLMSWEAYPSGGRFGLPDEPMIVFNPLSDRSVRPRYVRFPEHNALAEQALRQLGDDELRRWLTESRELD